MKGHKKPTARIVYYCWLYDGVPVPDQKWSRVEKVKIETLRRTSQYASSNLRVSKKLQANDEKARAIPNVIQRIISFSSESTNMKRNVVWNKMICLTGCVWRSRSEMCSKCCLWEAFFFSEKATCQFESCKRKSIHTFSQLECFLTRTPLKMYEYSCQKKNQVQNPIDGSTHLEFDFFECWRDWKSFLEKQKKESEKKKKGNTIKI